ncbi:MAG: carbon-nitrogen hydrolase family protein [Nocardioidaceae bacterium]
MTGAVDPLRVAVGQAESVPGDVEGNVATAADLVREAAAQGGRVLVLPELFLPGYDLATLAARPHDCDLGHDEIGADPRLEPLRGAATETGTVTLVGASVARADGRRTIAVVVVDADGSRHAYDKQHLWAGEPDLFAAGDHGCVITVDGWPLGVGVCYDGCFPDHARAAAAAGALAYLTPMAYVDGSEHRRDLYYRARALDNGCYAVAAGLVGRCGSETFNGGSAVHDPEGRTLVHAGDSSRAVLVADLDAAVVEAARTVNPLVADRVADLGTLAHLAAH